MCRWSSASEHLLWGVGHVEEAVLVLVVFVDLSHGERHAGQAALVHEQVESLRGQQGHPVPGGTEDRAVSETCWVPTVFQHLSDYTVTLNKDPQIKNWTWTRVCVVPRGADTQTHAGHKCWEKERRCCSINSCCVLWRHKISKLLEIHSQNLKSSKTRDWSRDLSPS